ncbi:hypothetical protein AMECASPLE_033655 [Ameca splendens]|uniref:Uncharacterized protein n=1 Tax=Ameca splendens TaxID=208324 RepID=A0ABV0ZSI6_9TELE
MGSQLTDMRMEERSILENRYEYYSETAELLTKCSDGGTAECFTPQQTQAWLHSLSFSAIYNSLSSLIHSSFFMCPLTLPFTFLNCKKSIKSIAFDQSAPLCVSLYVLIFVYASTALFCVTECVCSCACVRKK